MPLGCDEHRRGVGDGAIYIAGAADDLRARPIHGPNVRRRRNERVRQPVGHAVRVQLGDAKFQIGADLHVLGA